MHELSIAESILDAVREEMARQAAGRVVKIGLRIGPMAGVDRNSLEFCFEVVTKDTDLDGLALAVEEGTDDELKFCYMEVEEEDDDARPAGG